MKFIYLILLFIPLLASAETRIYTLTSKPAALESFILKTDGTLKALQSLEIPETPMTIAHSIDKKFLYLGLRAKSPQGKLLTIQLDSAGNATLISENTFEFQLRFIVPDKTGKFLLFADYFGGQTGVLELKNGVPTGKIFSKVATEKFAHGITLSKDNKNAYVPHTQPNSVYHFNFNEKNGTLTKVESVEGPGRDAEMFAPRHIKLHPSLPFLFTSNEHKGGISSWKVGATGKITLQQTLSSLPKDFTGRSTAADIHITPDGKFVYVSNRGGKGASSKFGINTIAGFSIDSQGKLSSIGFFEAAGRPRSFTISPNGKFLISAGQSDKKLMVSKIETSGKLKKTSIAKLKGKATWIISLE